MLGSIIGSLVRLLIAGTLVFLAINNRHAILAHFGISPDAAQPKATAAAGDDFGGGRTLRLPVDPSGHFFVDADVDGSNVRFLIDTGASDVMLTPEDASRLGIRLNDRDYTIEYQTAGGIIRAAPVNLREIRIGALAMRDVRATVNSHSGGISLLGMSFLKRLDGYAVERNSLVLTW